MGDAVKITAIIVGAVLLLALAGGFIFYKLVPAQFKGVPIDVTGNSVIQTTPDLVKVYFDMETNASTSSEATRLNALAVDDMTTSLIKLGLERKAIQTQNFNVYEWNEWENGKTVSKGFKASHQIIVELTSSQFSMIGSVIDAGANAEAKISYINFELSNQKQNEYKALAFKQASEDARVKAESIASGLGKSLGDVISVSTEDFGYNPWPIYYGKGLSTMAEASAAKSVTTNIQPSNQEVSGNVRVSYSLK